MQKLLSAVLAAMLLGAGGCVTMSPQEIAAANFGPYPTAYQENIENYMQGVLKDPDSATYRFGKPRKGFFEDGLLGGNKKYFGYIVEAKVNGKNSYGAYAGESTYYFILFDGKILDITQSFSDPIFPRAKYVDGGEGPNESQIAGKIAAPAVSQPAANSMQPGAADSKLIKLFSGNNTTTTRPFTVPDKWELQWDAQGEYFSIAIEDAQGNPINIAANQPGPGSGSAYQPKGGDYILQVNATGSWTIRIVNASN